MEVGIIILDALMVQVIQILDLGLFSCPLFVLRANDQFSVNHRINMLARDMCGTKHGNLSNNI